MTEKVIGFTLLLVGIIIILYSGYSVYSVYTREAQPFPLFQFDGISINIADIMEAQLPPELVELNRPSGESVQEIIPPPLINEPLNLASHLFLMSFIGGIGFKFSKIGVMMVRPIVVKMHEKKEKENQAITT